MSWKRNQGICLFSPSLEICNIIKCFPADSEKKNNTEALKLSIKQMFSENNIPFLGNRENLLCENSFLFRSVAFCTKNSTIHYIFLSLTLRLLSCCKKDLSSKYRNDLINKENATDRFQMECSITSIEKAKPLELTKPRKSLLSLGWNRSKVAWNWP